MNMALQNSSGHL